ncbi:pyruvoyl-dependent arginine decarboxylase [Candidatus Saccharibacteria bacterium]|nr:pyruvoyl-dependent arginine decarboxylase [Candidatus Saccharibacteria bacterium]
MDIHVVKASASGPTPLAAFDTALQEAGAANYNLIYLSSIIPAGSKIIQSKPKPENGKFGHKLYCVIAQKRETIPNKQAWAGIGWVLDKKTKQGMFVEHTGSSEDEVQKDIYKTLTDMMKRRPDHSWHPIKLSVSGTICEHKPVCSLVIAVYQSRSWD